MGNRLCSAVSANALLCHCSLRAGHARSHVCRGDTQHTKHVFFKTRAIELPEGFGNDAISRELERRARSEREEKEDRAAILDAKDFWLSGSEWWREKHAAAIARATGQEGAR